MSPSLSKNILALKPQGAYEVLGKSTQLEATGQKIIHFEIGQPDFQTPSHITLAGIKALQEGKTKYNPPLGILELRESLASYLNTSRHLSLTNQNIAVTPSGTTAIFAAMAAVLEPGDEVIYPCPGYPPYEANIEYLGAVKKPIPLLEKNSFSFDMSIFRATFSAKTKLIILNSPSNPTGGIIPQEDLDEIAAIINGKNCWVMSDEMYANILYNKRSYPSFCSIKGVESQTILVDGFSKKYAMTGWRIGYLAAPVEVIDKVDYLLTNLVGCTATFTQIAALAALAGGEDELNQMVQEFEKRRDYVVTALNNIPGVTCQTPEGAFYVFPNISSFGKSSKWLADYILKEGGVALLDGTSFGEYGEGYLRISYATSMDNLQEGIKRITLALKKLA